jgi:AraC-like DNA-binding protein
MRIVFTKHLGMTPTQYRANFRPQESEKSFGWL